MGDDVKLNSARVRRLLSRVFAQNPTAMELILYRFGLENNPSLLQQERPLEDLALLLGIEGPSNVREILNRALRELRG